MTRYQLTVKVEGLPLRNRLLGIRPNPYCKVHVTGGPRNGTYLGKSDIVRKSLNPTFATTFCIETDASEYFPIKICIYDDRKFADDQYDRKIAVANFEMTEIYRSNGHITMQTSDDNSNIKIYASLQESIKGNDFGTLKFRMRGLELKNVENGLFGLDRSDPYYEIQRKHFDHSVGDVHWNVVYRSQVINNHLNPYWDGGEILLESLCFCDINWPIKIVVFDHNRKTDHENIGEVETTVAAICQKIALRGNADRETSLKLYKASDVNDSTNTKATRYDKHHHIVDAVDSIRGYMVVLYANIETTNPSSNIMALQNKKLDQGVSFLKEQPIVNQASSVPGGKEQPIVNDAGVILEI